ncbi:cell envelope integrity protein TolA [Blochmannia endosymbiont of Camponotus nipponensis]|uniref:cell envelope integrity protein TolA n=1 Tax=Blochmannia endosymbiont of Camponotus nipponensis TaxID=2681986 RepID=UPI001EFFCCAC|nr:cell envelope integrity protein TolA [Blochmannia endosymbiont of Camponotus nipponensis]
MSAMIVSVMVHVIICLLIYKHIITKKQQHTVNFANHEHAINTFIQNVDPKIKKNCVQSQTEDRFKIADTQRPLGKQTVISNASKKKQHSDQTEDRFKIADTQRPLGKQTVISNASKKKQHQNVVEKNIPIYNELHYISHDDNTLTNVLNTLINKQNSIENNKYFKSNFTIKKNNDYNHGISNNVIENNDVNVYKHLLAEAIQKKFYNASHYVGKQCNLNIELAPDGTLLSVSAISGDIALCQAAIIAAKLAQIPIPPNADIYKIFKNTTLNFSPQ